MVNRLTEFLEDSKEVAAEIVGLIKEVVEPIHPPFDPSRQFATCMMVTCSMVPFPPSIRGELEDHVFRGQESVPQELYNKRVEEFRKKHPDTFKPIEDMHEKVYGTREWQEGDEKVTETVTKMENGGTLISSWRRFVKVIGVGA